MYNYRFEKGHSKFQNEKQDWAQDLSGLNKIHPAHKQSNFNRFGQGHIGYCIHLRHCYTFQRVADKVNPAFTVVIPPANTADGNTHTFM
jgi:hypothetical protein